MIMRRRLTSPDDKTLFRYSKKDSSLISLSVKRKQMPLPCSPAVLYKSFRSSIKFKVLYDLQKRTVVLIFIPFKKGFQLKENEQANLCKKQSLGI